MSDEATLLFLHGVGNDPSDAWKDALWSALADLGYSDLDKVRVITPNYHNALKVPPDDKIPLPPITVKPPNHDDAAANRRNFERRMGGLEIRLARHDRGGGPAVDAVVSAAVVDPRLVQVRNYIRDPRVRAHVLRRVLDTLPESGQLTIVGHSLGSVIAADLLRRLPAGLEVAGLLTIGSPLAISYFDVDRLYQNLAEPPTNLAWWVNFWSDVDPVTTRRGVSSVFPWMLDNRVHTPLGRDAHHARTYLSLDVVAAAVGFALLGSTSKEIERAEPGVDVPLEYAETFAILALRYAHLVKAHLSGDKQDRFGGALRLVQADVFERLRAKRAEAEEPIPIGVAQLRVDLADPASSAPEPTPVSHLSRDEAVLPLIGIAAANLVFPFEIDVPDATERKAMEELTLEMWLGSQIGTDVVAATQRAAQVLKGKGGPGWFKWVALGLGAVALVAATGGVALAAAPGVAGAAAITSALAAFGPGGMIGGLFTAGALASIGGGGIAFSLASPGTTAATVEAVVATKLAAAMLREAQHFEQDPRTWSSLAEIRIAIQREYSRHDEFSDKGSPTLKELKQKMDAVDRALDYLDDHELGPSEPATTTDIESRKQE